MLYPIEFCPRLKERIWGGEALKRRNGAFSGRGKTSAKVPDDALIGESWEVSGVEGDVSVIAGGFLKGNNLQEAVEIYMGELVGDKVFARFGEEFPLLIKLIDARDRLSVQVHPGDELAARLHGAYGKTEMWYVLDCEPGAELLIGFRDGVTRGVYEAAVEEGAVGDLLNRIPVRPGDAYFIPAGTVHAIGAGILLAEIQQTSDVTYRVFDWNRLDHKGRPRELHTDLALDAIDFGAAVKRVTQNPAAGEAALLVDDEHFTVNLVDVAGSTVRELASRDSFTVYVCTAGELTLSTAGGTVKMAPDGVVLVPADQPTVTFEGNGRLLETYI